MKRVRNKRVLSRSRIDAALFSVFEYPLTILEAPMGYGKTTAVKMFTRNQSFRSFWFTFSELSHSEAAFWDNFTDDITEMDKPAGTVLKSLGLPADAPQMERVLHTLGRVKFDENYLVVLDDYHLATDLRLNSLLLRLAQEELEGLSILLVTRDTTSLDFVELLSRGQCRLLPRQLLKFTEEELGDYCRMMQEHISKEDLNQIWQHTDGWISFAYLLLLGLENGIPVSMNANMESMIERALFSRYDSAMQDFQLRLSIMDEFTAEQAEMVTQAEDSAKRLKLLNAENAFVFYEERTGKYHIHQVLRNYLRRKRTFSAEELRTLYGRLGDWLLSRQEFLPAYRYLNQAGRVEDILSHLNDPKNIRNEWLDFDGADEMFDSVPRELLFQYPFAYLLHIFYSILTGKENAVMGWEKRLDELERHYTQQEGLEQVFLNRVLGEILIVRKFTMFNDVAAMRASDEEISRLLNGQSSYITLQSNEFTFASPHYLYLYFRDKGSFGELARLLSTDVGYARFSGGCGTGSDSLASAECALETGDLDGSVSHCRKAIAKAEGMSQTGIVICARFALIRLRLAGGKTKDALDLLSQMEREVEALSSSVYNTTVDLCKGYVFACLGQPERIPSWLQTGDLRPADFFSQGIAFNCIVYGKTLLALGKYEELEAHIPQFQTCFDQFNNRLGLIHNLIFEAVACCHLYGLEKGTALLTSALMEAQPDNLVLPFAENASHIIGMLKVIAQKNPGNEFYNRILTLSRKYEGGLSGTPFPAATLSQREIDILSLAAIGLSRKEMAARLYISEETAKTHFKNIYQKLGVNSKVAAIKLARDRGYLSMTET